MPRPRLITAIAAAWSVFHLWTGFFGALPAFEQRGVHLAFGLALVFLSLPVGTGRPWARALDLTLAAAGVLTAGYVAWDADGILLRSGSYESFELWFAGVLVLLVLEGTRRVIGWPLPVFAVLSMAYAAFGHYLPWELVAHPGYNLRRILSTLYLTYDGIFGLILGVSASFIFLFVLFGAFFRESGGGQFFLDLARSLFGRVRGGSAKASIVGSSLFGMISGSTVANVGTVGTLTIPLMKRSGFPPTFAAAVESAASVAGQIMPPVMGAAAFIMAEVLNVPYIEVAAAAAIPAALYYLALFAMVDLRAAKRGMRGLPESERPALRSVFRAGWVAVIPVAVLVYLMGAMDYSPRLASAWAIAAVVGTAVLRRQPTFGPSRLPPVLAGGALAALEVVMASACVGIIIGMVMLTGIGLKLSSLLVDVSAGSLPLLLVMTMVASLILGTALPTTATYVILAVLVAPAVMQMDVPPIAAHLFVFYFGVIADITPPTALCVFVASNIAGAPFQRTCWLACRLALAGFLLPFSFVYGPQLVLIGDLPGVALATITAALGVLALAAAIEGYALRPTTVPERLVLLFGTLLLIAPGWKARLAGAACLTIVLARQVVARSRAPWPAPAVGDS